MKRHRDARQVYLEKRRLYAKAVKRTKNLHRKRVCERLEQELIILGLLGNLLEKQN